MDTTPNLLLPYIMAAQAQKHVTHNEAIRVLDAIVQISVEDRNLATPPPAPSDGGRYIVAGSATDAWAGRESQIAAYQDGAWAFYPPGVGWIAWVADEDLLVVWNGVAWVSAQSVDLSSGLQNIDQVGVNATADTTNRLTVASASTLLNHDGAGHQLKLNKAAASDTASLLFQTAFSGRAEIGTAGDDNLHIKTSSDGSDWRETAMLSPSGLTVVTLDGAANGQSQVKARARGTATNQRASVAFYPTFGNFPADTIPRRCCDIVSGFTGVWGSEFMAFNIGLNGASNDVEGLGIERFRLSGDGSVEPGADNAQSLGTAARRWTQIYAASGAIQTCDQRDKIVVGDLDAVAGRVVDAVQPRLYKWKVGGNEIVQERMTEQDVVETVIDKNGNLTTRHARKTGPQFATKAVPGKRLHAGFLAQDIKAALDRVNTDFGAWGLDDKADPDSRQWLRPDQLIPVLWAALKETRAEVRALKSGRGKSDRVE